MCFILELYMMCSHSIEVHCTLLFSGGAPQESITKLSEWLDATMEKICRDQSTLCKCRNDAGQMKQIHFRYEGVTMLQLVSYQRVVQRSGH